MAEVKRAEETDQLRIKYGYRIVVVGFVLVGIIGVAAVWKWSAAGDVTAVVGSVTGVVGTVVGAFFGVQVGSAGKEKAEVARDQAVDEAQNFAGHLSSKQYKTAKEFIEKIRGE